MHAELLKRLHGGSYASKGRLPDVLDEHFLSGRRAALHAVDHDHVGTGFHCKRHVVVRARAAYLDEDRLLPIGDLAKLVNFDLQIVRPGPVGMTGGGALINPLRERPHLRDAVGDLLTEEHSPAARLGSLPHDDFDGIGAAKIVRIHAVSRRQILIDEGFGMPPLLLGHSTITSRG
jgi:hypothetical protein